MGAKDLEPTVAGWGLPPDTGGTLMTPWFAAAALGAALGAGAVWLWRRRRERALVDAVRRRDEHLACTVHELRTPLTAVVQAIEIVRAGYATTRAETEEFLEEAELAAQHLAHLVNDVVDAAAVDAGKLRLEVSEHRVDHVLRDGRRALGMLASRHVVELPDARALGVVHVRADARRVLQVLFNLVGNAIKHSPPERPVVVQVDPGADHVEFRVLDEGPGVPADVLPLLFAPFSGDERRRRADSTGLGLYVSKRIVEQMGGTIGHRPRAPRGAEFWFAVPRASSPTVAPERRGAQC